MKITVIGAGAIGTMIGAILSKKGIKISFLTKNKPNRSNIDFNIGNSNSVINVFGAGDLQKRKEDISIDTIIVNRIDNDRLAYMVTGIGSSKIETGKARFEGEGFTFLGKFAGKNGENISHLSDEMNLAGIECKIVRNIFGYVWLKAIINSFA